MIQDKLIEELDISVRALNSLKQARIKTIEEFLELTIERCKELGFSSRTIIEIETIKDSFCAKMNKIKTPIEYFIDYLKLHKVDDTYYLMQRQSIHQDFLEVIKRYEQEYIKSAKTNKKQ